VAVAHLQKVCTQCHQTKPGTEYSPNWTSPDGLRSNCKACQSQVRLCLSVCLSAPIKEGLRPSVAGRASASAGLMSMRFPCRLIQMDRSTLHSQSLPMAATYMGWAGALLLKPIGHSGSCLACTI
jgi:hypothetical protein